MTDSPDAYPLNWPVGWRRTQEEDRTRASFGRTEQQYRTELVNGVSIQKPSYSRKIDLTVSNAVERIHAELRSMGIEPEDAIISTNVEIRRDGLPYLNRRAPQDPGAAVYWHEPDRKESRCMAIDRYDRVQDNLAAIAATLNAMRAIERHGGAEILDRAFTGFTALPAPEQPWQVLGVSMNATEADIETAYRRLAAKHHPDRGGDSNEMGRINAARDAMLP